MAPWRSSVYDHYRDIAKDDRKCNYVECKYCGQQRASNNASRLVKHLLAGCCPTFTDSKRDLSVHGGTPGPKGGSVRPQKRGSAANALVDMSLTYGQIQNQSQTSPTAPTTITQNESPVANTPSTYTSVYAKLSTEAPNASDPISGSSTNAPHQPPLPPIYLMLRVTIPDTKDPNVMRLLAIPSPFTFLQLQDALCVAFLYQGLSGMFDITNRPGRPGRPSHFHICIFRDQAQKDKWHTYDSKDEGGSVTESGTRVPTNERLAENTGLDALLAERPGCKMVFLVGPWAHDIEVLGRMAMATNLVGDGKHAICLAGEGHPVVETSDPSLWQGYKDAYSAKVPNLQQKVYRMFYERECPTGDPNGLGDGRAWGWDRGKINLELAGLKSGAQEV